MSHHALTAWGIGSQQCYSWRPALAIASPESNSHSYSYSRACSCPYPHPVDAVSLCPFDHRLQAIFVSSQLE